MVDNSISKKLRLLAIATGCLVASTAVLLQWTDPIGPTFLALGAAIQPRSPRLGRWLMWVSALLMNVLTYAFAREMLAGINVGELPIPGFVILLAFALILSCDFMLVMDAALWTRRKTERVQVSTHKSLDWVVWIAALALSFYFLWRTLPAVRAYELSGRSDAVLTALGLAAIGVFFDIALIIHAFKSRRTG